MSAEAEPNTSIVVDGHVHITNRVYWEGIDPWEPQPFGFDYARAAGSGVNVVIENVAPYSYRNFNYTPKQTLRLVEAFHRTVERHRDKMDLALTAADARRIVAGGRLAVFLGIEAGFDNEGDLDVLRALYRLGVRLVQFSTQTSFNAFADAELDPPHWNGINDRGRDLIALMNGLGVLIDITHATAEAQNQIIEASDAPVVASHVAMAAVSGAGMSDTTLTALSDKGGMVGIIGVSASIGARYGAWLAANPAKAAAFGAPVLNLVDFASPLMRRALDHGEVGSWLDNEMRARHLGVNKLWTDDPETVALVPTPDEWGNHVAHVIKVVGAEHVGIGLDLSGGRSCVLKDASGYPELVAAIRRVTTPENLRKISGENWLRVIGAVMS